MPASDEDFLSSMFSQEPSVGPMASTQDFYSNQTAFSNPQNPPDMMLALQPSGTRQTLLESQLKIQQLQQLQQLQQQIFQQQMELLGGSLPNATFHGLPTPGSSVELRAQPSPEFVSPIMLHPPNSSYSINQSYASQPASPRFGQHLSNSAPANIAFHMTPSPADMDFDVSPLTSPWLEPYPQHPVASSSSNKRTASPSDDESIEKPSRKRRASATIARNSIRGSKSANSTPATRPFNPEVTGDSPSPVDISMPPPAHPGVTGNSAATINSVTTSTGTEMHLTPVTPASIMNLGRLGVNSSLVPPLKPNIGEEGKGKPTTRSKRTPAASPSLKPIRPADSVFVLQTTSQPMMHGKKSTHKDAEQKRRDSLKTSFDDLRTLLPPIPSPSDESEPLLPGAMPPRGPPRPGGGPNVNVSKLQLLRCGNDYIRVLKGRIERRDMELERLRRQLREVVGDEDGELDLSRDLDLVEKNSISEIMEADEAEDG